MAIYTIKNNFYPTYLNIGSSASIHQGTTVNTYEGTNSNDQRWVIDNLDSTGEQTIKQYSYPLYGLSSKSNYGCILSSSPAKIKLYKRSTGIYTIRNMDNSKYLTAGDNGVVSWESPNNSNMQNWAIQKVVSTVTLDLYAAAGHIGFNQHQMETNVLYIYPWLRREGFSKDAACAILGNMEKESFFNPGNWYKKDNTELPYGLVQFNPATNFLDWAVEKRILANNKPETVNELATTNPKKLVDAELNCFIYRCEKSPSDFIPNSSHTGLTLNFSEFKKAEGDVKTLAMYFCDSYERSGATGAALELRGTLALKWYDFITQNT